MSSISPGFPLTQLILWARSPLQGSNHSLLLLWLFLVQGVWIIPTQDWWSKLKRIQVRGCLPSLSFFFKYFILFIFGHAACGILVPQARIEPCPLCWKHAVLTTGAPLPRKVPCLSFKLFILLCRWIPSIQKRGIKYSLFLITVETVHVLVNMLMVKIKLCK